MMKRLLLLITIFVVSVLLPKTSSAQGYDYVPSKRVSKLYNSAQNDISNFKFQEAYNKLQDCIRIDSDFRDAYMSAALVNIEMQKFCEAADLYVEALKLFNDKSEKLQHRIGKLYYSCGEYPKAVEYLELYKNNYNLHPKEKAIIDSLLLISNNAISLVESKFDIKHENIGLAVNSKEYEYVTAISSDDSWLFFTRRYVDSVQMGDVWYPKTIKEIPYIAYKDSITDLWSSAIPISEAFPNLQDISAISISPDGNKLFYVGCNFPDSYGSCDIYCSVKTSDGWSDPINLGPNVNTEYWESQPYMSSDGFSLYFVSNRPGGYGKSDIWVSRLQENGIFGKAENLGSRVNTAKDEFSPFIHFDANTLYFTSDGYKGLGGLDLYKINLQDPNAKVVNLGYPINNKKDQQCFIVTPAGNMGYISSESKNGDDLDIYSLQLPKELQPYNVECCNGIVLDAVTRKPVENASVQMFGKNYDSRNTNEYSVKYSVMTPDNGKFCICREESSEIRLSVLKEGYFVYSENIDADSVDIIKTILLEPIIDGGIFIGKNITFDIDSYNLNDASFMELDRIYRMLIENPKVKLEISGHTDNTGTDNHNNQLSIDRANAVMNYLLSKGVGENRLKAFGYGSSKPIETNDTEVGRAMNRRTEFKCIIE